jgi:hypothetical protein
MPPRSTTSAPCKCSIVLPQWLWFQQQQQREKEQKKEDAAMMQIVFRGEMVAELL